MKTAALILGIFGGFFLLFAILSHIMHWPKIIPMVLALVCFLGTIGLFFRSESR